MNLTNNTILITGGTSGFGLEFAKRFIALGNTVIVTGRDTEKLDAVRESIKGVYTFQSDVSNPDDIVHLYEQVTQRFPALNMVVNNAGEMRKISLQQPHDLEDITREIAINLMGPIRMVQQFLPHLKRQKHAAILNVTSGIALMPFAISPIYSASKSGLRFYTQALRIQLKHTAVKVIELVAPGSSTPLNDKFKNEEGFNANMLMQPEKIVDAAIKGMQKDRENIYPGLSKLMLVLSRVAPGFMIRQAGKMGASFMYTTNLPKQ